MKQIRLATMLMGPVLIIFFASLITSTSEPSRTEQPKNLVVASANPSLITISQDQRDRLSDSSNRIPVDSQLLSACNEARNRLRSRLGEQCNIVLHPPFLIAGDLEEQKLDDWYDRTISPATNAMYSSYFDQFADEPITILLFGDRHSYVEHADALYGDRGISVYGYYKPELRTLVMNIDTGGGTLVHELTHALVAFDFPEIPDWFNEGLASLHEQCRFQQIDGQARIEGLVNWRLEGLQNAINDRELRTLSSLITEDDFRHADVGNNYAQARYLCLYLQRKGLLIDFYRSFRDHYTEDPTGRLTLEQILDHDDWNALNREFNDWALKLEF